MSHYPFCVHFIYLMSGYPFVVRLSILCPIIYFVSDYPFCARLSFSISCPIIYFVFDYPFRVRLSILCPIIYFVSDYPFHVSLFFPVQFSFSNDSLKFLLIVFSIISFHFIHLLFYPICSIQFPIDLFAYLLLPMAFQNVVVV